MIERSENVDEEKGTHFVEKWYVQLEEKGTAVFSFEI